MKRFNSRSTLRELGNVLPELLGGVFIIRTDEQTFRGLSKSIRLEDHDQGKILRIAGEEVLAGTLKASRQIYPVRDFAFPVPTETNCSTTHDDEMGYEVFIYPIPDVSGAGDHGNIAFYSEGHPETHRYKEHIRK